MYNIFNHKFVTYVDCS